MSSLTVSALTLCLVLGFAIESRAQDVVLPMKITMKTVRPGTSGTELKPAKTTLDAKDVFGVCVGMAPTSSQILVVAMDCGVAEDAILGGYDKTSGDAVAIGGIDFDYARAVSTTANGGTVTARTLPFTLTLDCSTVLDVTVTGVADITYKNLDGEHCPSTVKAKITGTGDIDPLGELLIDEGSSFSASKPIPLPTS